MKLLIATILLSAALGPFYRQVFGAETNVVVRRQSAGGKSAAAEKGLADELVTAAREGDLSRVQELLKRGAAPDSTNAFGWPAIVVAAEKGKTPVVAALLDHKANVNARGRRQWTAIMQAAKNGHLDTVQLLASRGARIHEGNYSSEKPIDMAAGNGHADVIAFFESKGAARAMPRMLGMAAYEGRLGMLKDFLDDEECAKYMKPHISAAFFTAATYGQLTAAEFLLSRGADVNYGEKSPRVPEEYGRTALLAVLEAHMSDGGLRSPEAVGFLIKAGADVNAKTASGETALQFARKLRNVKMRDHVVAQLIEAGAKE